MKFFSAAFAVALAGSSVSAETCVLTELATALGSLISAATTCQTATGYQIIPPTAYPTSAQVTAICADCQALITGARNVTFPTCTLTINGSDVAVNTLFNTIVGQCSGSGSSNSSTEITTPTPTPTPTPTTSSGSSASNSSVTTAPTSAPTTSTPSTTTAAPSTTTTSGGVSAVVGAAVAVACSVAALSL